MEGNSCDFVIGDYLLSKKERRGCEKARYHNASIPSIPISHSIPTFPSTTPPATAPVAETPRIAFRNAILRPLPPPQPLNRKRKELHGYVMLIITESGIDGGVRFEIYFILDCYI